MKILVVDDDPAILKICATALRAQGHVVVTCSSGAPALQEALRGDFDLALCDLNLPDVHGLDVVRAIKMQAPALAVIVMSALDPATWGDASAEAGATQYLSKPLRLDVLRSEVAMVESQRSGLDVVLGLGDNRERADVRTLLASAGCKVRMAEDSASLLCQLAERTPQLMIVDADMRDAHVVITVCGRRSVPCVVVAGDAYDDDRAMRDGASVVLRKPLDHQKLLTQALFMA